MHAREYCRIYKAKGISIHACDFAMEQADTAKGFSAGCC
jgi:hypothetical protein